MQYIVLVSDNPEHRESYDEPEAYGPYSEQDAEDVKLLLQLELDEAKYEITVLALQQYEGKNLV